MKRIPKVLLLLETGTMYGRGLARGVARYCQIHGPWSFYRIPPFYHARQSRKGKICFPSRRVFDADAIIAQVLDRAGCQAVIGSGLPSVITYVVEEPVEGVVNIVTDNQSIGVMGAEHFLQRHFKHFAYCGFDDMAWSRQRSTSFVNHIRKAGFQVDVYPCPKFQSRCSWDKEQQALVKWISSLARPTAVMACNDARAQDITEACKIAGLSIPEQVSVLGVDNDDAICELSDPPISSIPQNTERAGYEAAVLLETMMTGQSVSNEKIIVHPEPVLVRQSTDVMAIEDQVVAGAQRFIRMSATQIQNVSEVAEVVGISLRQLQKRFRKSLGTKIHDEIRRVRIQTAARLLMETTMPISKITELSGYTSPKNISRCFGREMGCSMMEYRKAFGKKQ